MDRHASPSRLPDPLEVDLSASRRRLLLAREQSASQLSAAQFRAVTAMRRWRAEGSRGAAAEQPGRKRDPA